MTRNSETASAPLTKARATSAAVPMHFRSIVRAQNTPATMPERFRDLIRREEQAAFLDKMTVLDWNVRTVTKTGVERTETAPEASPEVAAKKTRLSWILDSILAITVPEGHFTFKRAIKNAIVKGGIVLAAIASLTIPAEVAGAGLGMHSWSEDPGIAQDTGRVTQMLEKFECSYSGLPQGVKAMHGIVQDKADTSPDDETAKVVSFNKAWEIHMDQNSPQYLVAVCAK